MIAPAWSDVETLGVMALAKHAKKAPTLQRKALSQLQNLAVHWQKVENKSPYKVAIEREDFVWGSSAVFLNKAFTLLRLNTIAPDESIKDSAQHLLDYVLGRNPLQLSFVTGLGKNRITNIHHRVSYADGIDEPVPGGVVGGAQPNQQDKMACQLEGVKYPSTLPALSYVDHTCSYASNEVAINWNAPLVYVLAAMIE